MTLLQYPLNRGTDTDFLGCWGWALPKSNSILKQLSYTLDPHINGLKWGSNVTLQLSVSERVFF